jgi:hypothetical protein
MLLDVRVYAGRLALANVLGQGDMHGYGSPRSSMAWEEEGPSMVGNDEEVVSQTVAQKKQASAMPPFALVLTSISSYQPFHRDDDDDGHMEPFRPTSFTTSCL